MGRTKVEEPVEKCFIRIGKEGELVKKNGLEKWSCKDAEGYEWKIKRAIFNPETGSVWASWGADHDQIFAKYYKDIGEETGWVEGEKVPEEMIYIERKGWPNEWSLYNQTREGQERNSKFIKALKKAVERRVFEPEKDVVCVGTYVEHAQGEQACQKLSKFLSEYLKRCQKDPSECPIDTQTLRKALDGFQIRS
jgi:hypothetical protein